MVVALFTLKVIMWEIFFCLIVCFGVFFFLLLFFNFLSVLVVLQKQLMQQEFQVASR